MHKLYADSHFMSPAGGGRQAGGVAAGAQLFLQEIVEPAIFVEACCIMSVIMELLQAVGAKLAASLLAPSAFTFAADLVGAAEGAGAGLTWRDLWAGPYPVGAALCMLLGDAALYSLLAWCE